MIKITETRLRKGIQFGLGSQGIWTPELEDIMFSEISNQALSLCAVIISACECTCSNSLSYSNCDKKCKRYELEQADL